MTVWAGKYYLKCARPAQYFSKQVSEILLYISGSYEPLLPSFPSLWHDPKTSRKEKRLAPLCSGP